MELPSDDAYMDHGFRGFFQLRYPQDLLAKLRHDYALSMPLFGALVAGVMNLFRRRVSVPKAMCVASAIGLPIALMARLTRTLWLAVLVISL